MIVGLLISYAVLLPTLTWGDLPADADVSDVVSSTFGTEVRFVGAGAIAVAAVWTLLKILGPIVRGIRSAAVSSRARRGGSTVELTERDLPIGIVGGTILAALIPIALLLWAFLAGTPLSENTAGTTTCRTSRPVNWSARPRGSSRSRWSSGWPSGRW